MKYCKYCGNPIDEDGQFCSKCGKKIDVDCDTNHEELINNLKNCIQLLSPYQNKYDLRDQMNVKVEDLKNFNNAITIIVCLGLGYVISDRLDYTFWEMGIQDIGVPCTFLLIGVLLPIFIIRKHKNNIASSKHTLDKVNTELISYYNTVLLPVDIAFEYSNPRIINQLVKYLQLGRADTLKEAINCMISDQNDIKLTELQKKARTSIDEAAIFSVVTYLKK